MRNSLTLSKWLVVLLFGSVDLSARAAEEEAERLHGQHTPIGFAERFGATSIQGEEPKDDGKFVVQVGYLLMNRGTLLRFDQSSGELTIWTLADESNEADKVTYLHQDEEFQKLVEVLVHSAPTAPVGVYEAAIMTFGSGDCTWLFEYMDPTGGMQSMVTEENLLDGLDHLQGLEIVSKRDHTQFKDAFERAVKYALAASKDPESSKTHEDGADDETPETE